MTATTNAGIAYPGTGGGGGGSGASIENSAGTPLIVGDVLAGNTATSGTAGSGSGVVGFLQLDTNGNAVGNIVPRTGSLTSLQALAGTAGELASATDVPAVVQMSGTAGTANTLYGFGSSQSITVVASGTATSTIPVTTSAVNLTIPNATSYVGTLASGYIDGQEISVNVVSTGGSLLAVSVNGIVVNNSVFSTSGIPVSNKQPFALKFKWFTSTTSWRFTGMVPLIPTADYVVSTNIGFNNQVSGQKAAAIGRSNNVTVQGYAFGDSNSILGTGGVIVGTSAYISTAGVNSVIIGTGVSQASGTTGVGHGTVGIASDSTAIGLNATAAGGQSLALIGYAGGTFSAAINGASTGCYTSTGGIDNQTILSFTGTSNNYTVQVASTAGFSAGDLILLRDVGQSATEAGDVTSIVDATHMIVNMLPALMAVNSTIQNMYTGSASTAIGANARTVNAGAFAVSAAGAFGIGVGGDAQTEKVWLMQQTVDATPTILSLDNAVVNTNKNVGSSNRFITTTEQSGVVTLRLTAREPTTGNTATWVRKFLFCNNAGTLTLSPAPATTAGSQVGTDLALGAAPFTTTWMTLATVPFSVAANATYKSIDITVTGIAARTINWLGEMEIVETIS